MQGRFITIEGGEGAGKTTAVSYIEQFFRQADIPLLLTREPGGTQLGEQLREILLTPSDRPICPEAELLMMFAARAQHLQQVIMPALARGEWVLCDRFTDASFAYQGAGRELGEARVGQLETWLQGEFRPDCVILLDIDPAQGMQRVEKRGDQDRFEQEAMEFFQRVRQAYLQRASQAPDRYRVIDAGQTLAQVQQQLRYHLEDLTQALTRSQ